MALLLLSGCTLLGDSGSENVVPTLTEGTFEEDFSDPDAAWREESAGELRFQFQEGGYVVSAAAGRSAFVTARRYPAESRVAVETSFARIRDDSDERGGIFAVACQHFAGPEGLNSYAGVVQVSGGKGYPGLISWRDGEGHALVPLSAPAATFDPAGVTPSRSPAAPEDGPASWTWTWRSTARW